MVVQVLALPPHSKKVMGSIPAWCAVGSGGQVLPRTSVLRWAIFWPFCVEFACTPHVHKGFPPIRTPTEKHAKRTLQCVDSCPSLTDTDGSLGPRALRSCPLLLEDLGGGTIRDGLKAERKIHGDLRPPCACVCSVSWSPPYITCVLQ